MSDVFPVYNPFELFQLQPAPILLNKSGQVVSSQVLKKVYVQVQAACHPDGFATMSSELQSLASRKSANITSAFKLLTDDIARVKAWLAIENIDVEKSTAPDMETFELQMSLNESFEEVKEHRLDLSVFQQQLYELKTKTLSWFNHAFEIKDEVFSHDQYRLNFGKLALISRLEAKLQDLNLV